MNIFEPFSTQESPSRTARVRSAAASLPEDVSGGGADTLANLLVVEGIARYDASLGLTVASHTGLASGHINVFGSEALRAGTCRGWRAASG